MSIKPISNPIDKLPDILKQNLDKSLCVCNQVKKLDVINTIANGATTIEEVQKQTFATGGNGCCTRQVQRLIDLIHK